MTSVLRKDFLKDLLLKNLHEAKSFPAPLPSGRGTPVQIIHVSPVDVAVKLSSHHTATKATPENLSPALFRIDSQLYHVNFRRNVAPIGNCMSESALNLNIDPRAVG